MTIQSFVGIDGCKAGWMTVILSTEGNWTAKVYAELNELWRDYGDAKAAVDRYADRTAFL